MKMSKDLEKALKITKQLGEGKHSPKRVENALATYRANSKDFMSRFTQFALANEPYFQFLTDFFTTWKFKVKDLNSDELDNIFYAYELIQAHEEHAKALEQTIRKLSGEQRSMMDAFVVEAYPFYIQFLEIDLMNENDFLKAITTSLEVFQGFLKLMPKADLKKEVDKLQQKLNNYKEIVLQSELKLATTKIKFARYKNNKLGAKNA